MKRVDTRVCALEDILPDTGVCCLVGGEQVAVFRVGSGTALYAIGNFDPFSQANVLARGIVGDRGGEPKVASPIYKQNFSLLTGLCFDDPSVSVPTYEVKVDGGEVVVSSAATSSIRIRNLELVQEGSRL